MFEDRVQEIVKMDGEDHVVFKDHELTPLLIELNARLRRQSANPGR